MLRQVHFSLIDLELHSRFDPAGPESIFECDRRLCKNTLPLPPLPEDRFLCGFSHIFAGAPLLFLQAERQKAGQEPE
jgi:oligopeptidase A